VGIDEAIRRRHGAEADTDLGRRQAAYAEAQRQAELARELRIAGADFAVRVGRAPEPIQRWQRRDLVHRTSGPLGWLGVETHHTTVRADAAEPGHVAVTRTWSAQDRWQATEAILIGRMGRWYLVRHTVDAVTIDPIVRPAAYLNIVARLCGPGGEADPVGTFENACLRTLEAGTPTRLFPVPPKVR